VGGTSRPQLLALARAAGRSAEMAASEKDEILDSRYSWRRLLVTWACVSIGNVSLWSTYSAAQNWRVHICTTALCIPRNNHVLCLMHQDVVRSR
jgi:hypothetical protein